MSTSEYNIDRLGMIVRSVIENDGTVSAQEQLQPSSTPAYTLFLHLMEQRVWLKSMKNKIVQGIPALKAGSYYFIEYITMKGELVVRDFFGAPVPGLYPMAYFSQMVVAQSHALANSTLEQTWTAPVNALSPELPLSELATSESPPPAKSPSPSSSEATTSTPGAASSNGAAVRKPKS